MAASDGRGAPLPTTAEMAVSRRDARPAMQTYRTWLRSHIIDHCPRTLLDVGCGGGRLLDWAQAQGIEAIGLDPLPRSTNPRILIGRAERLPFETKSFDVVTLAFALHQVGDPARAIAEARRVARDVVIVMDPWFSPALPGQALAERFDRWAKRIDRAQGMDHHDCFTAEEMRALAGGTAVNLSYLVHLEWRDPLDVLAEAKRQAPRADDEALAELALLRKEIRRDGLTRPGAQVAVFG